MQGLCISLDVSKGSSYYQGFTSMNEPVGKAKKIEHDDKGFKELSKLKERMEKEYEDEVKAEVEAWVLNSKEGDEFQKYGMHITNIGR